MKKTALDQSLGKTGKSLKSDKAKRSPLVRASILAAVCAAVLLTVMMMWVALVDHTDHRYPVLTADIQTSGPEHTGSLAANSFGQVPAETPDPDTSVHSTLARSVSLVRGPGAPALRPDLVELSTFGPLPVIAADGLRPMDAYAQPSPVHPADPRQRIALVVGGLGLSQTGTQRAINSLPAAVTLAFAPTGSSLSRWVETARNDGHEVLLQIPLEPFGQDAIAFGPRTLLADDSDEAMEERLNWVLGRATLYPGVMTHMGAAFMTDYAATERLIDAVSRRGLFFLDGSISQTSQTMAAGRDLDAPTLVANYRIDRNRTRAHIVAELERLEEAARENGVAIGVASAFPASVTAIEEWASNLEERGFVLVPASAVLGR